MGRLVEAERLEPGALGMDGGEPVVLLLRGASGDEELGANGGALRGVILAHSLPHLSHLGARLGSPGAGAPGRRPPASARLHTRRWSLFLHCACSLGSALPSSRAPAHRPVAGEAVQGGIVRPLRGPALCGAVGGRARPRRAPRPAARRSIRAPAARRTVLRGPRPVCARAHAARAGGCRRRRPAAGVRAGVRARQEGVVFIACEDADMLDADVRPLLGACAGRPPPLALHWSTVPACPTRTRRPLPDSAVPSRSQLQREPRRCSRAALCSRGAPLAAAPHASATPRCAAWSRLHRHADAVCRALHAWGWARARCPASPRMRAPLARRARWRRR